MEIAFEGKSVLVTGVARGIGEGIARAFATRGADVHAADVLADELQAATARIAHDAARNASVTPHTLDLADPDAVRRLVEGINGGRLDIVVHAAGGIRGRTRTPIEAVSDADWHAIMDANVTSAFHLARAVAPGMKAAREGRIVFITSGAGLGVSLTGIQAYATAKAAEIGLTRQLAAELGAHNITVNSVAPGFMRTSPDYQRQWDGYSDAQQAALIDGIAMKRLGEPDDIANMVLFLASSYAGYVTGQTVSVKGGP